MKKTAALAASFLLPVIAFAQVRSIFDAGATITSIINGVLVPLVFTLAFIVFIWGVFSYFIAGDEEKRKGAIHLIIYGIVGFFVMVSVWGLVNILVGTFNLNQVIPPLPGGPGPR